jgi:hypothetical protein
MLELKMITLIVMACVVSGSLLAQPVIAVKRALFG